MAEYIKESLTMPAKKKPVQAQHIVLTIKAEAPVAHHPGTRGQSDRVPESL